MATTCIIACLFFNSVIYYRKTSSALDEKQWDISTVTTSDFTVDIEIPNEVWPKWKAYKKQSIEEARKKGESC